jgi:hypothetical protein
MNNVVKLNIYEIINSYFLFSFIIVYDFLSNLSTFQD